MPVPEAGLVPDGWRLALTGSAKALVTVFLVAGLAAVAGIAVLMSVVVSSASNTVTSAQALSRVEQANYVVGRALSSFPAAVSACHGQLTCVTTQDRKAGREPQAFADAITAAGVPAAASADAAALARVSSAAAAALTKLGSATTVGEYQGYAASSGLQQDLNQLGPDYARLVKDLSTA